MLSERSAEILEKVQHDNFYMEWEGWAQKTLALSGLGFKSFHDPVNSHLVFWVVDEEKYLTPNSSRTKQGVLASIKIPIDLLSNNNDESIIFTPISPYLDKATSRQRAATHAFTQCHIGVIAACLSGKLLEDTAALLKEMQNLYRERFFPLYATYSNQLVQD